MSNKVKIITGLERPTKSNTIKNSDKQYRVNEMTAAIIAKKLSIKLKNIKIDND